MSTKEIIQEANEAIKASKESRKETDKIIKEANEVMKEARESRRRSDEVMKQADESIKEARECRRRLDEAMKMLEAANETIQKTRILKAFHRILTDLDIGAEFDILFDMRYCDSENYKYLYKLYCGYKRVFLITFHNNECNYINEPEVLREKTLDELQNNSIKDLNNLFGIGEIRLIQNSEEILTDKYEILKNYINNFLSKLHEIIYVIFKY